jgi:uncharacterized protein YkwD
LNTRRRLPWFNKSALLIAVLLLTVILAGCSGGVPPLPVIPSGTSAPATATTQAPTSIPVPTATGPATTPVTTTSAAAPSPTPSPSPKPSSTPTPTQTPWPTVSYTPTAAPFKPSGALADLFQYTLDLINQDRKAAGLNPVTLAYNAAAQKHAQDIFDNYYLAHWGTDGLKPYMRFTDEGGLNYEQENSAYSGWYNKTENAANYQPLVVKTEIKALHDAMMAEVPPNDGHRRNILNKWHRKVSLGIAYDTKRLALVHQFEGDYVAFYSPPKLNGNILSLSGQITLGGAKLNNVSVAFDPAPQAMTADVLNNSKNPDYHSYGLGQKLCSILPPPPPGQIYSSLPADAILASKWDYTATGQFSIQADIGPALGNGKGVYTVVMVSLIGSEDLNLTNYSLYVK